MAKFSRDARKVLRRVWAASGGQCGKSRSSIEIRRAGDEVEEEPRFFEGDTVAHCGPALNGEFARTVKLTDARTGWVFTRAVRNNAHIHILGMLMQAVEQVPYAVTGLDFDNGTEFLNKAVIAWVGERENDQATVESKNNHLVRKYGFYCRYDTAEERAVLNRLWPLVSDRFSYLTPTMKPIGFGADKNGRRKRLYDKPQTPLDRLLAANMLAPSQAAELTAYRDSRSTGRRLLDEPRPGGPIRVLEAWSTRWLIRSGQFRVR